jgi:hypothetical protein
MAFAIQCVGVPWLVISGAWTAEYIVNDVPFLCLGKQVGDQFMEGWPYVASSSLNGQICDAWRLIPDWTWKSADERGRLLDFVMLDA